MRSEKLGAVGIALCWAIGCRNGAAGLDVSLPSGTYDVAGPLCVSTMQPPEYTSLDRKLALFAFTDVTTHTLSVSAGRSDETLAAAGCSLTVSRSLHTNDSGNFALRHDRVSVFTPEGCTLTIKFDDTTYAVGAKNSQIFAASTDQAAEIPYRVNAKADAFELTTADQPALNDTWQTYGCPQPDQLQLGLKLR